MLTLLVLEEDYSRGTKRIPWLLMPWFLVSPGHQQSWKCLYRINCSSSSALMYLKNTCVISLDVTKLKYIYKYSIFLHNNSTRKGLSKLQLISRDRNACYKTATLRDRYFLLHTISAHADRWWAQVDIIGNGVGWLRQDIDDGDQVIQRKNPPGGGGFIRGCAAPGSEPLPYFRESQTPKPYTILGKSHNPGHPKRSGLQKHTLF